MQLVSEPLVCPRTPRLGPASNPCVTLCALGNLILISIQEAGIVKHRRAGPISLRWFGLPLTASPIADQFAALSSSLTSLISLRSTRLEESRQHAMAPVSHPSVLLSAVISSIKERQAFHLRVVPESPLFHRLLLLSSLDWTLFSSRYKLSHCP